MIMALKREMESKIFKMLILMCFLAKLAGWLAVWKVTEEDYKLIKSTLREFWWKKIHNNFERRSGEDKGGVLMKENEVS